jgi:deoxycytidylate deaminase
VASADMALRAARRQVHRSRKRQHRIVAILVRGGAIISTGWNLEQAHAEAVALRRAWRTDVRGARLYVFRFRTNDGLGLAKPCPGCQALLRAAGVHLVYFSTDAGGLEFLLPGHGGRQAPAGAKGARGPRRS